MKSSNVSEDEIRRPRGVQREDVWAAADAVLLAGVDSFPKLGHFGTHSR